MAGMFSYFADAKLKTNAGLATFPDNIIQMSQHMMTSSDIPYIPGAPFLTAAAMGIIAFVTFLIVTNSNDRKILSATSEQSEHSQAELDT